MKQMICNISNAAAMTITAIAFLLCACSREDVNHSSDGLTTTISLNIPMLSSSSRATIEGSEKENAIHNLRVIILKQGAESINLTFDKDNFSNGKGTIEIKDVPVGQVEMYVIANEASLGKDYTDLKTLQQDVIDVGNSRKVLIKDESRAFFPKRGSEFKTENSNPETTKGLSMSWMNKDQTINPPQYDEENNIVPQNIIVELQRCVAKLNITMTNVSTEEDIVINEMNFGAFFGDKLYLFQETDLDVPANSSYVSKSYENLKEPDDPTKEGITISKNSSKNLVLYIYPTFAWTDGDISSPYTIGFKTNSGVVYKPQYFINDYNNAFNSIPRNKQVNINAKLSKSKVVDLKFSVEEWDKIDVDVPAFE